MRIKKLAILPFLVFFSALILMGCQDSKSYNDEFNVIFYTGTNEASSVATLIDPIINVTSGELVTRPDDPVAPGVEFLGWYKEKAGINLWDFENDTIEQSTVLYAKWNILDLSITYVFDEAGGDFLDEPIYTYSITNTIILPKATRLGSLFLGWILTPVDEYKVGNPIIQSTKDFSSDLVFYALFENKIYTVRFRSLLTGVANPLTHTVEYASDMDFPVLNDTSTKRFVGWFGLDGTETGEWGFQYVNDELYLGKAISYDPDSDTWEFLPQGVTLYAKWEDK
ncbi:MAG: InlB B-repeat-containing protein [Acholeplasmataceae bacterium]|nr:InlB B-repeat-containing protein [Acholeplasmataceae bacterium]